ncbi:hypothetical protein J5N97_003157 [Dioscorea zingiberensis]|uniref:Uncharacterized protein n=1 Tax=Dioscorea zingiberensis TaxID=325984 RepID=A0A9D5D3P4_9LILI|nr:hypothetical protein J5N97_003157 [Dioscorea zingiberensis]
MMKPTMPLIISFLSLVLLINIAQGIRLEDHSLKAFYKKTNENRPVRGETKDGVILCGDDDEELCSGKSRKLTQTEIKTQKKDATSSSDYSAVSPAEKADREEFHVETPPMGEDEHLPTKTYPDVLDIAGMDYSPAKRKPPIHN